MRMGAADHKKLTLFTIPAGVAFADALAHGLLGETKDDPKGLSSIHLLLPTRRATRTMQNAFLRLSKGAPILLPRLSALGEVDEDSLSLESIASSSNHAALTLPPAMPKIRRQILLARMIMEWKTRVHSPDQAFALAGTLGRLIDQCYMEGVTLDALPTLVPDEFADHWRVTLDFLSIIMKLWPALLDAHGMIDAADRSGRLTHALADHWDATRPTQRIIAAGSTGSIPATARLLRVIAGLPNGSVILPALDRDMDDDSWAALDDSHPQQALKKLLHGMDDNLHRHDVTVWPHTPPAQTDTNPTIAQKQLSARQWLAREMMRPAATADAWTTLDPDAETRTHVRDTLGRVRRIDAENPQEEAEAIALILRETLETPGRTASLVTPDRMLARRVSLIMNRWGIVMDDSGGQPLSTTRVGIFLRLIARAAIEQYAPAALLAAVKHSLVRWDDNDTADGRGMVRALDRHYLRGPAPARGWDGLTAHISAKRDAQIARGHEAPPDVVPLIDHLRTCFAPLDDVLQGDAETLRPLPDWLNAHIKVAEHLSRADTIWTGEDGEAAATVLAELHGELAQAFAGDTHAMPPMRLDDYLSIISGMMEGVNIRPAYGTHPRLSILGQIEARMSQADCVILAGLNDGTWPPDPGHDPWMSRPMRKQFGLPPTDQMVGFAAHDFACGFCAPTVYLSRSKRVDGTPTVPSRWLQRLDTVLQALDIPPEHLHDHPALHRARMFSDDGARVPAATRPAPTPAVDRRPMTLPVTDIETWMRDPYALYAKRILRLRKLDMLDKPEDAASRGTLIHEVFEHFVSDHMHDWPDDAQSRLITLAHDQMKDHMDDPRLWGFWWPRMEAAIDHFVTLETAQRAHSKPWALEATGTLPITLDDGQVFTLTAKADRIDRSVIDGRATVIDYKTGTLPSKKAIEAGLAPQLPLEGAMILHGGFNDSGPKPSVENLRAFTAWDGSGRKNPTILSVEEGDAVHLATYAYNGLRDLVTAFQNPATPYYSLPNPANAPKYRDYDQLARVQEWVVLSDADDEAEDAA